MYLKQTARRSLAYLLKMRTPRSLSTRLFQTLSGQHWQQFMQHVSRVVVKTNCNESFRDNSCNIHWDTFNLKLICHLFASSTDPVTT